MSQLPLMGLKTHPVQEQDGCVPPARRRIGVVGMAPDIFTGALMRLELWLSDKTRNHCAGSLPLPGMKVEKGAAWAS